MGCITSRPDWPPKPQNQAPKYKYVLIAVNGRWQKKLVKVEDGSSPDR
jgi:hypothetical protein